MAQQKYCYTIKLQYLNAVKGTYKTFESYNIKYLIIDRDYDNLNMPILYISVLLDKNDLDDIIKNVDTNLMNIIVYKHLSQQDYDIDDIEDSFYESQCAYFINDQINPTKEIDYGEGNEDRNDINTLASIGLIPLGPMNKNMRQFRITLNNSTMINAIKYTLSEFNNLVIEPLDFNPTLEQIPITAQDTVSKALQTLNSIKVLYRTPYRFFMDFDSTYLVSSGGYPVPKHNEKINTVLISVKSATDSVGIEEGMTTNRKQGNYQVLVPVADANYYNNKATEKLQTKFDVIDQYGSSTTVEVDINSSSYNTDKVKTLGIYNDNVNLGENIKAQTESEIMQMSITKDCIDSSIFSLNNTFVIKNFEDYDIYDGQYLMSRKREIFILNGQDFYMTVLVNFKMIRKKS